MSTIDRPLYYCWRVGGGSGGEAGAERGLSIDTTLLGGQQGEKRGLRCATRSSRWD